MNPHLFPQLSSSLGECIESADGVLVETRTAAQMEGEVRDGDDASGEGSDDSDGDGDDDA